MYTVIVHAHARAGRTMAPRRPRGARAHMISISIDVAMCMHVFAYNYNVAIMHAGMSTVTTVTYVNVAT